MFCFDSEIIKIRDRLCLYVSITCTTMLQVFACAWYKGHKTIILTLSPYIHYLPIYTLSLYTLSPYIHYLSIYIISLYTLSPYLHYLPIYIISLYTLSPYIHYLPIYIISLYTLSPYLHYLPIYLKLFIDLWLLPLVKLLQNCVAFLLHFLFSFF